MRFSLRTMLLVILFFGMWLGAILSRSPIAIEIASLLTALTLFMSLPLAIFDANRERRPFWAGYFSIGIGVLSMSSIFELPINTTSHALAQAVSARSDLTPDSIVSQSGTTVQTQTGTFFWSSGETGTTNNLYFVSIKQAVPLMLSILLAVIGGFISFTMARNRNQPRAIAQTNKLDS